MKKIYMIVALAMISVMSWATVNISVSPNVIDFGTVNLDENGEYESDWLTATLSWSGLQQYCGVFVDTLNAPGANDGYEFYISSDEGIDYWYGGDEWTEPTGPTVWVKFYALEPGNYEITYSFYSFEDEDWTIKSEGVTLTVRATVHALGTGIDEAEAELKAEKMVRHGQVLIRRNGVLYDLNGRQVEK